MRRASVGPYDIGWLAVIPSRDFFEQTSVLLGTSYVGADTVESLGLWTFRGGLSKELGWVEGLGEAHDILQCTSTRCQFSVGRGRQLQRLRLWKRAVLPNPVPNLAIRQ